MSYPAGWDLVNITGTYIGRNGVPCTGSVTLSSPQLVLRSGTIVPAADIVFDLVNGTFSGQIPATDDPNADPSGWTYTVTENVPGGRQGYQIVAPHTSPGIDLSTVVPVTMPMPPTFGFPYVTLAQLAGTGVGQGAALVGFQQAGTGSVPRTVQSKEMDVYNVFDLFTSVQEADALSGSPTIDTTALIQQALQNAAARGQRCHAYGTFRVSGKIVISGNADFSDAVFLVYGSPAIALEVSTGSAADPTDNLFNTVVRLPRQTINMNKPSTGWAGQGVGVRLVNLYSCEVHFGHVKGFLTNVLVTSFGGNGNGYNEYHCDQLDNGMVNLQLNPGDSTSWVNENLFLGGRFDHNSAEGTSVSGVRHILISSAVNIPNNNMFVKPSVEGDVPEYHVENAGTSNTIIQGRWEATTPKVLYSGANSGNGTYNTILYGYDANKIAVTNSGYSGSRFNQIITSYNSDVEVNGINSYTTVYSGAHCVTSFGGDGSGLQLINAGSSSYGCLYVYNSATPLTGTTNANYNVRVSANFCGFKGSADAYDRMLIQATSGILSFGDGTASPGVNLFYASGGLTTNKGLGMWSTAAPAAKPAVTGSKGGNAALASLIAALVSYGIISDSTT